MKLILFILSVAIIAACKPMNNSEVQSLENFAAGTRIRTNMCSAQNNNNADLISIVRFNNKVKNISAEEVAKKVLSAVPRGVLEYFIASNGIIHISNNPMEDCKNAASKFNNQIAEQVKRATAEIDPQSKSCSLQSARKSTLTPQGYHKGLPSIDIFISPVRGEILHELLRQFGLVLFTYYSQTNVVVDATTGQAAGLMHSGAPLASIAYASEKLAHAYLLDLSKRRSIFSLESVDVLLGTGSGGVLDKFMLNGGKVDFAPIERSFEGILKAALKADVNPQLIALRAASFRAMVALEAFDSYYCNNWGKFDVNAVRSLIDGKIPATSRDQVLAAQEDSQRVMQLVFPNTFDAFNLYMKPIIDRMASGKSLRQIAGTAVRPSGFRLADQTEAEYLQRANGELTQTEKDQLRNPIINNLADHFIQRNMWQARNDVATYRMARLYQLQSKYDQVEPQLQQMISQTQVAEKERNFLNLLTSQDMTEKRRAEILQLYVQPTRRQTQMELFQPFATGAQNPFGPFNAQPFGHKPSEGSQIQLPVNFQDGSGDLALKRLRGEPLTAEETSRLQKISYAKKQEVDSLLTRISQTQSDASNYHQLTLQKFPQEMQQVVPQMRDAHMFDLASRKQAYITEMKEKYPHIDPSELAQKIDQFIYEDGNPRVDFYDQPAINSAKNDPIARPDSYFNSEYLFDHVNFARRNGLNTSINNNVHYQIRDLVEDTAAHDVAIYRDLRVEAVKGKDAYIDAIDEPLAQYQTRAELMGMTPIAGIFADGAATATAATRYVISGGKKSSLGEIGLNAASGVPVLGYLADGKKIYKTGTTLEKVMPTMNKIVTNPGFLKTEAIVNTGQIGVGGAMFANSMWQTMQNKNVPADQRLNQLKSQYEQNFGTRVPYGWGANEILQDANARGLANQMPEYQAVEKSLQTQSWGSASLNDDAVGSDPFATGGNTGTVTQPKDEGVIGNQFTE